MEIYGRRDELGLLADQYLDQDKKLKNKKIKKWGKKRGLRLAREQNV